MNIPQNIVDCEDLVLYVDRSDNSIIWKNLAAEEFCAKATNLTEVIQPAELNRIRCILNEQGFFSGRIKIEWGKSKKRYKGLLHWPADGDNIMVMRILMDSPAKEIYSQIPAAACFENLAHGIPDMVLIHQGGHIVFANQAACDFFGFSKSSDYRGKRFESLIDDSDKHWYRNRLIKPGNNLSASGEVTVLNARGKAVEVTFCTKIMEGTDGVMEMLTVAPDRKRLISENSKVELDQELHRLLEVEQQQHSYHFKNLMREKKLSNDVLSNSLDAVFTLDNNRRIKSFNRASENTFEGLATQVKGKIPDFLFKPKKQWKVIQKSLEENGTYCGEVYTVNRGKRVITCFLQIASMVDESGRPNGYLCICRDISPLRKAEKNLKTSEARYKDILENANDYIFSFNDKGRLNFANSAFKQTLDYKESTLYSRTVFDLLEPKTRESLRNRLNALLKTGKDRDKCEVVFWARGRNKVYVELNINIRYKGESMELVRCIGRDISDARKAKEEARAHAGRLEAIFDSGNILFWTMNRSFGLISFNKRYSDTMKRLHGMYPKKGMQFNKRRENLETPGHFSQWYDNYQKCFAGDSVNFKIKTTDQQGNDHFLEVSLNPVRGEGHHAIEEVACIAIDVSDKKLTQQKLDENVAQVKSIFESSSHVIWSLNTNYEVTSFNSNFVKVHRAIYGGKPEVGSNFRHEFDEQNNGAHSFWKREYDRALKGEHVHFEVDLRASDKGKKLWHDIHLNPIFDQDNQVIGVSGIGHDISYKKQAEKKISDQAAKINSIFDSSAMFIFTLDSENRLTSFNQNFAKLFEKRFQREINLGDTFKKIIAGYATEEKIMEFREAMDKALAGATINFLTQIEIESGNAIWVETHLNPIFTEKGAIQEISCMAHEVTEKKMIEERVRESLREKEILLQEVHHRVKNNLQVISSILNLQTSYVKDTNTLDILKESQNRIKTMSFIHESLYQNHDFSSISLKDYLNTLSQNLLHSYSINQSEVKLKPRMEQVTLNLDQAIPCGLIVNELITNSLKYAFPANKAGTIKLSCKEEGGRVIVAISDNGVGLPKDFDIEETESLGLQLVITLVDQLDAELKYESGKKGTNYLINFARQGSNH